MIIKHADDRNRDIDELNALLKRHDLKTWQKEKIQTELKKRYSGRKGEEEAEYSINFHFGKNSKNWMVIHDLHIEYEGETVQIDHLILNRLMEIYICESKNFNEGITINEHGEFAYYHNGKACGIASPIEQNERHRLFLQRMFEDPEFELPTRLGFRIKPKIYSLILIGNGATIKRPSNGKAVKHLDRVIKNDQIRTKINKDADEINVTDTLAIAKVVSRETLREFAEYLASLHLPPERNWKAELGISNSSVAPQIPKPNITPQAAISSTQPRRLFCADCQKTVTPKVAEFCWNNKTRFQGKVYCFNCQKNDP